MIAPLYNKFSQEFKDVCTPYSQLSASHRRKLRPSLRALLTFVLLQVKFYRVDIDEDKIAATVAEAGVASVVLPLSRLVAASSGASKRGICCLAPSMRFTACTTTIFATLSPAHAVFVGA